MAQRNLRKEYDTYHGTLEQKLARACRNRARREAEKKGKVAKGDGREVDHVTSLSNGGACGPSNTRVVSRETNRKKAAGSA